MPRARSNHHTVDALVGAKISDARDEKAPYLPSVIGFNLVVFALLIVITVAIEALLPFLGLPRKGSGPPRGRRALLLASAALGIAGVLVAGWEFEPYRRPERYLPEVDAASRPIVDAIDRYAKDHGAPPSSLDELVPAYLDAIPESSYRGDSTFEYARLFDAQPKWWLSLDCAASFDDTSEMRFDSERRAWRIRR